MTEAAAGRAAAVSLAAKSLAVGHRAGVDILSAVDLEISPGELIGLVGANGAGKSTLMQVLAGLKAPNRGEIFLHGTPLAKVRTAERARKLSYVPQSRFVHWPIKVRDLVGLGRLPYLGAFGAMSETDLAAVDDALRMTDTLQFENRRADTLSGGELARVLLARALAQTPTVLLADEPTAGLDPAYQFRLLHLLRSAVDRGIAVMAVFHELALAARFCDRLVLLHQGRIHKVGKPADVLTEETVETVYGVKVMIFNAGSNLTVMPIDLRDESDSGEDGHSGPPKPEASIED